MQLNRTLLRTEPQACLKQPTPVFFRSSGVLRDTWRDLNLDRETVFWQVSASCRNLLY